MTLPEHETLSPSTPLDAVELPRPRGETPPPVRGGRWRWPVAGLAAVLAGGGGGWAVQAHRDAPDPGPAVQVSTGDPSFVGRRHPVGEAAGWQDGVTAVVRAVRRTSFDAMATTPGPGLRVTVSVTNGSRSAVDLYPTADVRVAGRTALATPVYAEGCDGLSDLDRLAPGRTATGTLCYAGTGPAVEIAFTPTYGHNAITWTATPH